jgi:PadR family transcriptional regulator PadR
LLLLDFTAGDVGRARLRPLDGAHLWVLVLSSSSVPCIIPTDLRRQQKLAQMRKGALEFCVLALLRMKDRYGLELARELAGEDGLLASQGTLYPLLNRLHSERLVETYSVDSQSGPPRRYYRITKSGERAVDDFVPQWKSFRDAVDDALSLRSRR